ncbi:MAG: hypothetical protein ACFFAS_20130 [Promethearchaeota archaeon]
MDPKKTNNLAYFSVYFIAQSIYIYVNAFLPIFFQEQFSISGIDLGLVLYSSYLFMLSKPVLAIYISKEQKIGPFSREKKIILAGAIGALITFSIFIFNLSLLLLFGLLLGLNFFFISLMDVFIDKFIVERSPNDSTRKQNAFYIQIGTLMGTIIPHIYFFLIQPDDLSSWNIIFFIGTISLACTVLPLLLLKDSEPLTEDITKKSSDESKIIRPKLVLFMSTFLFLTYSVNLYEWVIEPWAIIKLAEVSNNPKTIFPIVMILFTILDAISLLMAGKYSKKLDKTLLLFVSVVISGVMTTIAPLLEIVSFFLLIGIVQISSGFFLINMIALVMEISKGKIIFFQVMMSSTILAKVVLAPLGLFLFDIIPGEVIISIAGMIQLVSLIPLYKIFLSQTGEICKKTENKN